MRWLAVPIALALLLYPLLVYWGGRWLEPRYMGLVVVGFYALRTLLVTRHNRVRFAVVVACAVAGVLVWAVNSETLLLLVPALINAAMAVVFGYSLLFPPTIPARVARRFEGELTPAIERYTTRVAWVWLIFFGINGSIALATVWAEPEVWALYNGVIAYGLIGAIFLVEYICRQITIAKQQTP